MVFLRRAGSLGVSEFSLKSVVMILRACSGFLFMFVVKSQCFFVGVKVETGPLAPCVLSLDEIKKLEFKRTFVPLNIIYLFYFIF